MPGRGHIGFDDHAAWNAESGEPAALVPFYVPDKNPDDFYGATKRSGWHKTLTLTITGTNAKGQTMKNVAVYEKQ